MLSRRIGLWLLLAAVSALISVEARGRSKKPKATFYVDLGGKPHVRTVAAAIERALARLDSIDFTSLRHLLEPVGKQLETMARAGKLLNRARELMKNLEVEQAVKALARVAKLQRRVFHLLSVSQSGVEEHGAVYVDLAIARFLAGDENGARQSLHQAFLLVPGLEFDAARFPPQMKRLFDEVRFLVDELGSGAAVIKTVPPGAEVRVNGRFVGFSPVRTRGLAAGPNLVTVYSPGHRTRTWRLYVPGGKQDASLSRRLRPLDGEPLALLASAVVEAQSRAPRAALPALARRLGRNVVFVATTASRDDLVTVRLQAYDAAHNRVSAAAEATISALDPDQECRNLVDGLVPFLWSRPARRVARRRAWWERVQKWRYFWPVVGAAASVVVVGAAVGVGVYYGTRGGDDRGRNVVIFPAVGTAWR